MVEHLQLSIDDLLLDQNNPRLGFVRSQSEALEAIINLNDKHFRALMLSIKRDGLDPGDSLFVINSEGDDDFVVLEGNRRCSALLVLNNPSLLDGTEIPAGIKKKLVIAAAGFDRSKVEPIRCVKFGHREDAYEWIYRRHTGAAEGEGRIQWQSLEKQRFSGDHSILDVIDFVGRNAGYSAEEWKSTKSAIENRKSSSLARLLESSAGRAHLGITISDSDGGKTPLLQSEPRWAAKVLRKIFDDVRDGKVDSRDLNKASDIENYFQELPKALQPQKGKSSKPLPFKEISIARVESELATKERSSRQRTISSPKPQRNLAPREHLFKTPTSSKGKMLLEEASTLDANKFRLSAAFVLRGFLELAVTEYMEKNGIPTTKGSKTKGPVNELFLKQKVEKVHDHIIKTDSSKKKDLNAFRTKILADNSEVSIQSLNGAIHNEYQIPTPDALRAGWHACVPILIATFGKT